jgi:hypothetical protein
VDSVSPHPKKLKKKESDKPVMRILLKVFVRAPSKYTRCRINNNLESNIIAAEISTVLVTVLNGYR